MLRSQFRFIWGLILLCFLQGCFQNSRTDLEASFQKTQNLEEKWWLVFQDEALNKLLKKSVRENLSYQMALKNVEIAKTYMTQNESQLYPNLNLGYSVSRNRLTSGSVTLAHNPYNLNQLQGTVSYELDIWGRIRDSVRQSTADWASAHFGAQVVRLTVISAVMSTYFQIKSLLKNIETFKEQVTTQTEILKLLKAQNESGLIDATTLSDAENDIQATENLLRAYEVQFTQTQNFLALLLGKAPDDFAISFGGVIQSPCEQHAIPENVPAEIMRRRPDVQQAFHQMVSSKIFKKINDSNYFPHFSLTGNYGYASSMLSNFLTTPHLVWNFGLSVLQPVLDWGNLKSQADRSKLQYESSVLNYRLVIISALNEVSNALVAYQKDRETLLSLEKEVKGSEDKLKLLQSQYEAGLSDYAAVLSQRVVIQNLRVISETGRLQLIQDLIQVYKAFGYDF